MFRITLDTKSNYALRFPKVADRADILALAQRFVAYEQSLPPGAQTPFTADIIALLEKAIPMYSSGMSSEVQRTVASEAVKRLDETAKVVCEQIYGLMKVMFATSPERAKEWGFQIKQATGHILRPRSRKARLALLNAYIAKEESCPPPERFTVVSLDEVRRVRNELQANLTARNDGKDLRERSNVNSRALTTELFQQLQAAAVYLLAKEYHFSLSLDLRKWGYEVTTLRNGHSNGHGNGTGNGSGSSGQ